jgi:hypothetical protein
MSSSAIATGDLILAESGGSERSGGNDHLHTGTGRDALGRVDVVTSMAAANLNAICHDRRHESKKWLHVVGSGDFVVEERSVF